jgi:hypothetical protein
MAISREDVEAGRVDLSDVVEAGAPDLPPVFPGEILRDWMDDVYRAISAETALRLGRFFGTSPQFWLNLQTVYDLEVARAEHGHKIEREVLHHAA